MDKPGSTKEELRLSATQRYLQLSLLTETGITPLVQLAAKICTVPLAFIAFIEHDRMNLAAKVGLSLNDAPISGSLIRRTLEQTRVLEEENLSLNEDTAKCFKSFSELQPQFYAGAPLVTADGYAIAILGVLDYNPRRLEPVQQEALLTLARQAMISLELKRKETELDRAKSEMERQSAPRVVAEESSPKMAQIFENTDRMVMLISAEGDIEYANPQLMRQTGLSSADLLGRNPRILKADDMSDEDYAIIWEKASKGAEWQGELHCRKKNGELFWEEASISPIRNTRGDITHYIKISEDITSAKEADDEMMEASIYEWFRILAGGIAHDFNNMLTAIYGNISLARMYVDLDGQVSKRLSAAEKACIRAKELTQQLLSISKGAAPLKDAASIIQIMQEAVKSALQQSYAHCELTLKDDLWPVKMDTSQIGQAFHNLVINADESMTGGGTIRIKAENVVVDATMGLPLKPGKFVKVSIADQGGGTGSRQMQHLLDHYQPGEEKTGGLRLATTYFIIKQHNGYIAVDSKVGVGTTFNVYLPAYVPEAEPVKTENRREIPDVGFLSGKGKILIMDDEESIRDLVNSALTNFGYEVEAAEDGFEAIDRYTAAQQSGKPFDAVILDLTVPGGMGGVETIKKLRNLNPHILAIVSSGYSNDPVMANYKQYGFCAIVAKPYRIEDLNQTLHSVLKTSRQGSK